MKPTRILLPALMLGLAVSANGQIFHVPAHASDGTVLKSRTTAKKAKAPAMNLNLNTPAKVQGWGGTAINEVEKYGTLRLVFEEDFSLMAAGSIEEPETETEMVYSFPSECEYPWWNMKPEFVHQPNWGGGADTPGMVGQAGGCYYMNCVQLDEFTAPAQAHINTPPMDVSNDGGIAVLEFKARSRDAQNLYPGLYIEFGETHNMGPAWDFPEDPVVTAEIPAEWTTFRIMFRGCGATSLFNIVAVNPGEVFLDDLKVYQLVPYVDMPELYVHTDYKGTSFVANWAPVEGAEKYLVSLYYQEQEPAENPMARPVTKDVYVFTDKEVTENKLTIDGVETGQTYYYTVKAVKGDKVSPESFAMRVYDLEVPVMGTPEILDGCTYTANWSAVPYASAYNYFAYDVRKAEADGVFVVTDENFDGVRDAEGNLTGYTKEDPWDNCYDEYYSNEINQQGWRATNSFPYTDYLAMDAFFYETEGDQTGFISPEFDMSKDGGKFVVEADLAGDTSIVYDDDNNKYSYTTQACVAVFSWNEKRGDYDQVELVYPDKKVTGDWQHFTFNLTKGSERTVIGLFAIGSYDNLYLDNFKVTQNYKAGESLLEPFRFKHWHGGSDGEEPTTIDVEVPGRVQGLDIYHSVCSHGRQSDAYGQGWDDRQSAYSPIEFVMTSVSGVSDVAVDNNDNAPAEYFRIDGIRVAADKLTPGVYVVRKGSTTSKVVVK